jgi:hypothetical protein
VHVGKSARNVTGALQAVRLKDSRGLHSGKRCRSRDDGILVQVLFEQELQVDIYRIIGYPVRRVG